MQRKKVKRVDSGLCLRARAAMKSLHMPYKDIARDAGLPSYSQLVEIANGVIEPSKRILKYLCSRGFSGHWLLTGEGNKYWLKESKTGNKQVLARLQGDFRAVKKALDETAARIEELRKSLGPEPCGTRPKYQAR